MPSGSGPGRRVARLRWGALALPLVAAAGLLAGCARRPAERPPARAARTPTVADTLANGLPRALAPALAPWVAMWGAAVPGFELDSLVRAGRAPAFRYGAAQPAKDFLPPPPEQTAVFAVLAADSPGGRYKLVFDGYQAIVEEQGGIEIGGEPDSAPILFDLRRGTAHRFEFCGTSCSYHWGCWLDSSRFALAGVSEDLERPGRFQGFLGIYSIADSSEVRYLTRAVPTGAHDRYRAAWQAWVTARYQAWKRSRVPS